MDKNKQQCESEYPKLPTNEFFTTHYSSLLKYCHNNWNGSGQDVLHTAWVIAVERYEKINFSLFCLLAQEAARNERVYEWQHDENQTIIVPPPETRERLELHRAVAPTEENESTHKQKNLKWIKAFVRAHQQGQELLPCFSTQDKKEVEQ